MRFPLCYYYFHHFPLDNYPQKGIVKIAFGWGQKAIEGEDENDRRRISVRYFQSAGIGARGARRNYKPHLKGEENEN
jgi:hypothetical protein